MRIVFLGSAELAVASLRGILEVGKDEVVGVVSQPDRPAGRKRVLTPCSLKAFAESCELHILTPEKVGAPDSVAALADLKPDLFVVVAYGQYIPSSVIQLARFEAINVHPSLLPKYRGSSPIQWALLNGDTETGVSIIYLAKKMDAGDILQQKTYPLGPDETSATLHDKLALVGADLLRLAIDDIRNDTVVRRVQNESQVIEIRKFTKEDGAIDWTRPAKEIRNRIRAFDPWPGSFCELDDGTSLKVWKADLEEGSGKAGEVLDDQLLVATATGAIRLTEVQPPGKKRMSTGSFLNGRPIKTGSFLS